MKVNIFETSELSALTLTKIFQERVTVFVVEQQCPYQEIDEHDEDTTHIWLSENSDDIRGYSRVIQKEDHITFGRVLVPKKYRGQSYGKKIIEETIAYIRQMYGNQPIRISGQHYLEDFYHSFGFQTVSAVYLEDDIPHIDMILEIPSHE